MNRFLLIAVLASMAFASKGQAPTNIYAEDSTIKVWANGHQNQMAWSGGFNNPQFAFGDLNHDGKQDMVVYEASVGLLGAIKTFINTGTAGSPNYMYYPQYAQNFPEVNAFLKLEDYNRDGITDLITRGSQGFAIYKGKWNAQNQLTFTFFKDLRFNASGGIGNINAYSEFIPAVVDVDGDGDLDFLSYQMGSIISFYKNCQVELGLPKDSIEVCWPTQCWGRMFQGQVKPFYLSIAQGSTSCPTLGTVSYCKGTLHGGNNICIFDYDGDGDMDLLDGNYSYSDIQFAKNGRAQYGGVDSMISQDTSWQSNGHQLNMPLFPAAFYVDADQDGKKDLLISPQGGAGSENYKCIAYYRNTGTLANPVFTFLSDTLFVDHSIDAGTASHPLLYDFNKDGRLDLIVGSEGYYQPNGTYRSKLLYYQNTLVGNTTQLVLQTTDLAGVFAQNFYGAVPAVGDLDGDGKDDLVLGHVDGTMSFYRNMASSNTVAPQWQLADLMMKKNTGDTIRVSGGSASPFIYDINKDGKPDLLVGHFNGGVYYFQNVNTTGGTVALQQVSNVLGGMNANYMSPGFGGVSTPFIGRIDNTNKPYILLGTQSGIVLRYDGFQSGNTNMVYNLIDTLYSGIDVGDLSAVAVGDIDNDGKYDMVIGNQLGGLQLFRQDGVVSVSDVPFAASTHCAIYPNPAKDAIYCTWDNGFSGNNPLTVRVVNMTGQVVAEQTFNGSAQSGMINVKHLATGTYIGYVSTRANRYTSRFTIVR